MKKTVLWVLMGVWLGGIGLVGCGQTGPLYLPKPAQPAPTATQQTSSLVKPIATPTQSIAGPNKSIAAPTQQLSQPTH